MELGPSPLAWCTDIHLDFLQDAEVEAFCREIARADPAALLLSGDISVAPSLTQHLLGLEKHLQRPIYFVLGNHDYYGGSIAGVRERVQRLCRDSPWLHWLPAAGVVPLNRDTGLLGHDGWGDGRLGAGIRSRVLMTDFYCIEDLASLSTPELFQKLAALGDEAAAYLRGALREGLERFPRLILLTHVPPFRESCWHEGRISDDDFLPHFTCRAVGDVLRELMQARPDRDLTVLCGHTHGRGYAEILPNLRVWTGGAEYGKPGLQPWVELR
jgi:3',5'-cyclic AMP phosphodiesterase CpdA